MFRRIMLALTFVAALGVSGLGITNSASAYGGHHRGGYGGFYGPPVVYRSYGYGYGPRYYGSAYYPSFHRGYGGYGGAYIPFGGHHRHHGGVYFSIGF